MSKQFIYSDKNNAAKNFAKIVKELRKIAQENGMDESETIHYFIKDIMNEHKEEYEKELPDIVITGLTDSGKKSLINYLKKLSKEAQRKENRTKKEPERLERKALREKEKADKREEQKLQDKWKEICMLVEKKSQNQDCPLSKSWVDIKNKRFPKESNKELDETEKKIKEMIENEAYYQEVKYFTYDFRFLAEDSLKVKARLGIPNRKFYDIDNYMKYNELKIKIRNERLEERFIKHLL